MATVYELWDQVVIHKHDIVGCKSPQDQKPICIWRKKHTQVVIAQTAGYLITMRIRNTLVPQNRL